jgi:hypothetical protein
MLPGKVRAGKSDSTGSSGSRSFFSKAKQCSMSRNQGRSKRPKSERWGSQDLIPIIMRIVGEAIIMTLIVVRVY